MNGLHFRLVDGIGPETVARIAQAKFFRHGEGPLPSSTTIQGSTATVLPADRVSGAVEVPWFVPDRGEFPLRTASLIQRAEHYDLPLELARGELNKARNQAAKFEQRGTQIPAFVYKAMDDSTQMLSHAVFCDQPSERFDLCQRSLAVTLQVEQDLAEAYSRSEIPKRKGNWQFQLGCVLSEPPLVGVEALPSTFDHVSVPVHWPSLEPEHGRRNWEPLDRMVDWCMARQVPFTVGPLLDFSTLSLPAWLLQWLDDTNTLLTIMMDLVETCIDRYQDRVVYWETTARTNSGLAERFTEDQMLWIASQMVSTARNVKSDIRIELGFDQPWGEYRATSKRLYRPSQCVDLLLRTELPIAAVNLEIAMGYAPGGSFCRSMLDVSHMLDEFEEIGVPVHLWLYFPSGPIAPGSGCGSATTAGFWRRPFDESLQADWAEQVIRVALAKPFIQRVAWGCWQDGPSVRWPLSGLFAADGRGKPILATLQSLHAEFQR